MNFIKSYRHYALSYLALGLLCFSCTEPNATDDTVKDQTCNAESSSEDFACIVKFLSSDAMKGRWPGTPEMKKIEDFTINLFKKYGIHAFGGSYLQNVPIKGKNEPFTNNILGFIEGSDDNLKREYVMICGHYDHLGLADKPVNGDNIYNGARDNAVGIAAILRTAIYYAKHPPKRSIIFSLFTAEEIGLLGSKYMANNMPINLDDLVYVINTDGAGYNDKAKVTFLFVDQTNMKDNIFAAVQQTHLTPFLNIIPSLNTRTDHYSFVTKGIPSITIALGFKNFDEALMKYYHKVTDEYESLDFDYLEAWLNAFIETSKAVVNSDIKPVWADTSPYKNR